MNKNLKLIIFLIVFVGFLYGFKVFVSKNTSNTRNAILLSKKGSYKIQTQTINYFAQTKGFLAVPAKKGTYPGVVMIHEWWGLNDNIRDMAKLLASYGYSVLAVDLYKGVVAQTQEEARKQIGSMDQEEAIANMRAAVNYLKKNKHVSKVASLGWCFGGGQSLKLSLSGEQLDATVIYYGDLFLEVDKLRPLTWPVLGIFGDKDTAVPVEGARKFDSVLTLLNTPHEIYIYPEVGHAFANPSGTNYAPKETQDAWEKTIRFLDIHLKN